MPPQRLSDTEIPSLAVISVHRAYDPQQSEQGHVRVERGGERAAILAEAAEGGHLVRDRAGVRVKVRVRVRVRVRARAWARVRVGVGVNPNPAPAMT